ncbi:hypothetical protein Ddye_031269 [Dipteronia dyeriana]|uniref:Uncharacterized protein n=1 Tax=Dipteronia dyeriana TaxID=168575 RepID=A0AAD9TIL7_9ROSI|nr:hypothetical protein Ddye_031269 [Dipteronia dyeriana]
MVMVLAPQLLKYVNLIYDIHSNLELLGGAMVHFKSRASTVFDDKLAKLGSRMSDDFVEWQVCGLIPAFRLPDPCFFCWSLVFFWAGGVVSALFACTLVFIFIGLCSVLLFLRRAVCLCSGSCFFVLCVFCLLPAPGGLLI